MTNSAHIEQTLFFETNPATAQYFDGKSDRIFQAPGESSIVEYHEEPGASYQKVEDCKILKQVAKVRLNPVQRVTLCS